MGRVGPSTRAQGDPNPGQAPTRHPAPLPLGHAQPWCPQHPGAALTPPGSGSPRGGQPRAGPCAHHKQKHMEPSHGVGLDPEATWGPQASSKHFTSKSCGTTPLQRAQPLHGGSIFRSGFIKGYEYNCGPSHESWVPEAGLGFGWKGAVSSPGSLQRYWPNFLSGRVSQRPHPGSAPSGVEPLSTPPQPRLLIAFNVLSLVESELKPKLHVCSGAFVLSSGCAGEPWPSDLERDGREGWMKSGWAGSRDIPGSMMLRDRPCLC